MIDICGRKVKVLARINSQTINVCTAENIHGQYDYIVRLYPPFIDEDTLLRQKFNSIEDMIKYLQQNHHGQIEKEPSIFVTSQPSEGVGMAISVNMADLGSYERVRKDVPRRHDRGKDYFVDNHDGIPSTENDTNREEEHLAIALWNRFGPGKTPITLPDGTSLTLLDYQFPLKARQDDKGVGKVDLFGVTDAGQAWVIELKRGANRTDLPSSALEQALGYTAMVQANMDDIRSESKGNSIREDIPAVCVMAPEEYWDGQTAGLEALRMKIETELSLPVRFVTIKMSPDALTLGINGNRSTLNGDILFDYVEVKQAISNQLDKRKVQILVKLFLDVANRAGIEKIEAKIERAFFGDGAGWSKVESQLRRWVETPGKGRHADAKPYALELYEYLFGQIKEGLNMSRSSVPHDNCSNDRTDAQGRAYKGSQLQIQIYVNRRAEELNAAICAADPALSDGCITWVSPVEENRFEEYKDEDFLRAVGMSQLAPELVGKFWPKSGPQWDALARVKIKGKDGVILVEAKNYPDEIEGNGCKACPHSRSIIEDALKETKQWLGVPSEADWMGKWYQPANRLAHLYFLNEVVGVPAWLVNVHILDDPMHKPTSLMGWETALAGIKSDMGLAGVTVPCLIEVFLPALRREELG